MKTNDKDIEKMATEYADENYMVGNVSLNDFEYDMATDCYKAGFKACEAKMLAESSENFDGWWYDENDNLYMLNDVYKNYCSMAFTAGAMSQAKKDEEEINHTMQVNEGLGIRVSKLEQEIQKLKADNHALALALADCKRYNGDTTKVESIIRQALKSIGEIE